MRDARRYQVALAIGLGLAGTAGFAALASSWAGLGVVYPLTAVVIFAAMMAAVIAVAGHPHPHARFGAANVVTTVRVMLMALAAGLVGQAVRPAILWWVVAGTALAAALDGVDGWLARRTRTASEFGARFDMETDAALILVLSILVWQHGKAGAWVLLCGLMRYGFVAAGRLLPWLAGPLRSTVRGKTVAVVQIVGLSVALAPLVPVPASAVVAGVTLAALVWSFAIDVVWLLRSQGGSCR